MILDDVPDEKWPTCCFCRRPRFVLLHRLQDTAGITPGDVTPFLQKQHFLRLFGALTRNSSTFRLV